jgi:hypothetical protein
VHCELQLTPTGVVVHFITSCIVVCAFAVPAHHVIVMANASPGCIVCAFAGPANAATSAARSTPPPFIDRHCTQSAPSYRYSD